MEKISMRGTVAPIITVFNDDESINEKATKDHIDFLLDNGITGIVVCGSTGESVALSMDERKVVAEITVEHVNNRVPVFVGAGAYRPSQTVELCRHAKAIGADGLLIVSPHYMQPTLEQLMHHFRLVSAATDLPIILYDNPGVTGFSYTPDQMSIMVKEGLISGVKLTGGDPAYVHELRYLCGNEITIFYGADSAPLQGLLAGADGWISGVINLIPRLASRFTEAGVAGNVEAARELFNLMEPLMRFQLLATPERDPHWLSFLKTGLALRGRDVGKPRLPLLPLNKEFERKLAPLIEDLLRKGLEVR